MSKIVRAIGLMSGTSLDGVDIALIETDGESHVRQLSGSTVPYEPAFRRKLAEALVAARALKSRDERPNGLAEIEQELTEIHAEAVKTFIGNVALQPFAVDVIGFHGQTVLHKPEAGMTVQLGDGPGLAAKTGIDVIYDLRAADVAAGGQGAPLVPVYHRALATRLPELPVAFLNVGGVANVTWVGPDGALIAFDTGPGNALLDDWMLARTGKALDEDGRISAAGKVDEKTLHFFMSHPHFAKVPPKSLDRNAFPLEAAAHLSTEDGAATLTAFTAEAIVRARAFMPEEPHTWIVCGGGRRNRTLMSAIAARVENAVVPAEAVHLDGDNTEAEAWAYLAARSLMGLPITFPGTTGVDRPITGGLLAKAG